ncbi:MAG TPA: response regulator transcription factor, partial [Terriglobia bacterium]|nr:response regulator transcription factor [Terriglobia bacterium]
IAKNLRSHGFAVDLAADGTIGEELSVVHDYDVILLDILMPKQDGWTTCRKIRDANVRTPILMLTALDDVDDKIRGLDSGADDYLAKPFHIGELLARIRSLARRHTDVRRSSIERFGVRLDTARHKAFRGSKELTLSTKEFALLELFMMNAGTIVTRERILEHVWDMNFDPRSNVIESFVRLLRQKIDSTFRKKLIHTVRGSGYIFTDEQP